MTEELKEITDEQLSQATSLILEACRVLQMDMKLLFDKNNPDRTVGFVLADKGVLLKQIEVIDESGIWETPKAPRVLS